LKIKPEEMSKNVTDANKASKIVGMPVKNEKGEDLGKVKDIVLDTKSGKVAYAVLSAGGTMGVGGKLVAVPWEALTPQPGGKNLAMKIDKEECKNAPGFGESNWPNLDAVASGKTVGLASSSKQKEQQKESAGGSGSSSETSSGSSSGSSPITDFKKLTTSADPSSLEGKSVKLSEAKVKQVVGSKGLMITSSQGGEEQIFVKSSKPVESIKEGQTVSVTGTAHKVPSDPSKLGLEPEAEQQIQGKQVYVDATQVTPSE